MFATYMVVYDAVIVLDHQMDKLYFVLFVFLVGGARATGSEDMQPVWHELGALKYYIHNGSRVTYHNATIACESMDAKLAQIKTQEVQTFLEKLIPKGTSYRDAWFIGLKRMRNSSFHWDDGTMVSPGYANWDHKEPNNSSGDEYCVEIRSTSNYKWNDIPCHQKRYYICQRKAVNVTTDVTTDVITHMTSMPITSKYGGTTPPYFVIGIVLGMAAAVILLIICIKLRKKNSGKDSSTLDVTQEPDYQGTSSDQNPGQQEVIYSSIGEATNVQNDVTINQDDVYSVPRGGKRENDVTNTQDDVTSTPDDDTNTQDDDTSTRDDVYNMAGDVTSTQDDDTSTQDDIYNMADDVTDDTTTQETHAPIYSQVNKTAKTQKPNQ